MCRRTGRLAQALLQSRGPAKGPTLCPSQPHTRAPLAKLHSTDFPLSPLPLTSDKFMRKVWIQPMPPWRIM